MRFVFLLMIAAELTSPARAQIFRLSREQMIKYTAQNPFERFPDGRPKVEDAMLERVKHLSLEEAWGILLNKGIVTNMRGGIFRCCIHCCKRMTCPSSI